MIGIMFKGSGNLNSRGTPTDRIAYEEEPIDRLKERQNID